MTANTTATTPKPGDPATICYWSDEQPATVIQVSPSGKTITVQEDAWKVIEGSMHDGSARYEYTRNPKGATRIFTLRVNGRFVAKGESKKGTSCHVGSRRRYYDPHF